MSEGTGDRRRGRHEATRDEIVRQAWALAAERGLAGWSLRDLADTVGMRAPSLYVYFDSKNGLYDAMFADGYRVFLDRIAATPPAADPASMVRKAANVFFSFCVEDAARFELLFLRRVPGFEPAPESYALATDALDALVDVLAAAGVAGQRAVDMWTAVLTGLVVQQISNDPGGKRWARLIDEAVDMFLATARPADQSQSRRRKKR